MLDAGRRRKNIQKKECIYSLIGYDLKVKSETSLYTSNADIICKVYNNLAGVHFFFDDGETTSVVGIDYLINKIIKKINEYDFR